MESVKHITEAIIKCMAQINGVEKNKEVGTGLSSYKAVSDQDVKNAVRNVMTQNGLALLPIAITPTVRVDRWEESYGNGPAKPKQSIFTQVETKYLLVHTSGESMEIAGYGHGIDTQDKSAGKATTYALKNALLYLFLIPTGAIDDTDNDHSDDKEVPGKKQLQQDPVLQKLQSCTTAAELQATYKALSNEEQIKYKDPVTQLKAKLIPA